MRENRRTANSLRRNSPKNFLDKNSKPKGLKKKRFEKTLFEMNELPNNFKHLMHSAIPTRVQAEKKLRSES